MSREIIKFKEVTPNYNNALTATAVNIKTKAGYLVKINAFQIAANAATYIQLFNALAADVVLGTTVPNYVIYIPAGASGVIDEFGGESPFFSTAISWAATTAPTGAVAPANAIQASYLFA